jgi:hypothetical protein
MPNPPSPRKLTPQQIQRLRAYIYVDPPLDHYQFLMRWDVDRELISQVCHVNIRTVNTWLSKGSVHQSPQRYHLWYLSFADIILERFDELPDFLKVLFCPLDDNF